MRKIIKQIQKEWNLNTRGYKEIEIKGKQNEDGSIVIYEIGQWSEEKEANTFDYGIFIFNSQGELIYDECDGEIKGINKIHQYYEYINSIDIKDGAIDEIRKKLFYSYLF